MEIIENIFWDMLDILYFYGIQLLQILTYSWYEGLVLVAYFTLVIFLLKRMHRKWPLKNLSNFKLLILAILYSVSVGPGVYGLGGVSTAPFPWMFGYSLYQLDEHNIALNLKLLSFSIIGLTVIFLVFRIALKLIIRHWNRRMKTRDSIGR